jgi:hypothetical protein
MCGVLETKSSSGLRLIKYAENTKEAVSPESRHLSSSELRMG